VAFRLRNRSQRERRQVTLYLPPELAQKLKIFSVTNGRENSFSTVNEDHQDHRGGNGEPAPVGLPLRLKYSAEAGFSQRSRTP
jgi:hypothetical protein